MESQTWHLCVNCTIVFDRNHHGTNHHQGFWIHRSQRSFLCRAGNFDSIFHLVFSFNFVIIYRISNFSLNSIPTLQKVRIECQSDILNLISWKVKIFFSIHASSILKLSNAILPIIDIRLCNVAKFSHDHYIFKVVQKTIYMAWLHKVLRLSGFSGLDPTLVKITCCDQQRFFE